MLFIDVLIGGKMLLGAICFGVIGIFISFIFTLLMINFDAKYKLLLQTLVGVGGNGLSLFGMFNLFSVQDSNMKFAFTISFFVCFLIGVFFMMFIMCKLIKDKDDNDVLRIRDILLGQKSYIQKYYKQREKEIDNKLNIPMLEERERIIKQKEDSIINERKFLEEEEQRINELGKKKIALILPENRKITITEKFISVLPSYIGDFSRCVNAIRNTTEKMIDDAQKDSSYNVQDLSTFLMNIIMLISNYLFGKSNDIRIHFRIYDESTKMYEKFVAIEGDKLSTKNMTPIPFEGSMIQKSFNCKRALIKSINSDFDYQSNNNQKWKDYMTYTFYNITRDGRPILSFGISVKNENRFKDIFYFLNFVEIDTFLNEIMESINEKVILEDVLYREEVVSNEQDI